MNVSVIIPVYKAEHFIRKAVESALFHDEVREIILVEDGSPDGSLSVCQSILLEHSRVKLYQHPGGENRGAGASRNLGMQKATQEFICFLDADDLMTSIRFDREKEVFHSDDEVDGVYGATGVQYYDEKGAAAWVGKGLDEKHVTTINKSIPHEKLFDFLVGIGNEDGYAGYFTIDALTVKRSRLNEHYIYFNEDLRLHQDTMFIWQCAYFLKLYAGEFVDPIAIRGVHGENRFINHHDLNESRAKQFKALWEWAKKANLKRKYQEYFMTNYKYFDLSKNRGVKRLLNMIYYFLVSKYFRRILGYNIYIRYIK